MQGTQVSYVYNPNPYYLKVLEKLRLYVSGKTNIHMDNPINQVYRS